MSFPSPHNNSGHEDLYAILEVARDASIEELHTAYRRRSLQYHPDREGRSSEASHSNFIRLTAAYELLSDPLRRREYDEGNSHQNASYSTNHGESVDKPGSSSPQPESGGTTPPARPSAPTPEDQERMRQGDERRRSTAESESSSRFQDNVEAILKATYITNNMDMISTSLADLEHYQDRLWNAWHDWYSDFRSVCHGPQETDRILELRTCYGHIRQRVKNLDRRCKEFHQAAISLHPSVGEFHWRLCWIRRYSHRYFEVLFSQLISEGLELHMDIVMLRLIWCPRINEAITNPSAPRPVVLQLVNRAIERLSPFSRGLPVTDNFAREFPDFQ